MSNFMVERSQLEEDREEGGEPAVREDDYLTADGECDFEDTEMACKDAEEVQEDHVFDDLPPTEKPNDDVLHEEINEKPRYDPKLDDPPKHEPTENDNDPQKELQPEHPLNNLSPPKDGERLMFIHSNCKRVGL